MKLIADGGSSKTKWGYGSGASKAFFESPGINLHYMSDDAVLANLSEVKDQLVVEITEIHFYGSGISSREKTGRMNKLLQQSFGMEVTVTSSSDFLGAARALFQKQSGVACILGTGVATGIYGQGKIIKQQPSLGFWLGDEGGGADLGKRLVKAYLRKELPLDLLAAFEQEYGAFDREYIFDKLKTEDRPNTYFASFAPFFSAQSSERWAKETLETAFEAFAVHHLVGYDLNGDKTIGFVGSIAYYFQDELKKVLAMYFDNDVIFLTDALEGLMDYHVTNVQ
ncbi:MAG: glucosamine kinase [Arcticibacterium sp.]|jgi:glucosamine kinase